MHVPLLARGPGFGATTVTAPVCAQDITATCLKAAIATPTLPIDGADLRAPKPDRVLLHERDLDPLTLIPSGVGVTTVNRKLWRHEADDPDRYEMYLLDADPQELINVAYDPAYLDERNALEAHLDGLLDA
jgi:arylsulfatase A-like enzyme